MEMNSEKSARLEKEKGLPFLIWLVVISTLGAGFFGGTVVLGYNISGYAWLVPFFVAFTVFFKGVGRLRFPLGLWMPWIAVVAGYLVFSDAENALQRSTMLLCPIFIGMAVSTLNLTEQDLFKFRRIYRYIAIVLYIEVVLKSGLLLTGKLPATMGLAPQVMTGALVCSLFATNYMYGEKKDILWWSALAAIPVIGVTRMGMIATGISLPLTFAPMKIAKRIVLVAMIVAAGYAIFLSERVQHKMFFSGRGSVEDIASNNPNLATYGRKEVWARLQVEIEEQPWFGHGSNESETFIKKTSKLEHPHNDWLRLLYDYGYVGTVIFGLCVLLQMLHLIKTGTRFSGERRILFFGAATSFISFLLFMFTDNIILYVAFFGNLQFTIIGFAYASAATVEDQKIA